MKQLYTYGMACLLAVSVVLASAGLPLFAHMCKMGCKAEVSLVAENSCCKKSCSNESGPGIAKPACCEDQALFLKKELPGLKTVKILLPLVPEAMLISTDYGISAIDFVSPAPQNNSPPRLSGRALLNHIHILRT